MLCNILFEPYSWDLWSARDSSQSTLWCQTLDNQIHSKWSPPCTMSAVQHSGFRFLARILSFQTRNRRSYWQIVRLQSFSKYHAHHLGQSGLAKSWLVYNNSGQSHLCALHRLVLNKTVGKTVSCGAIMLIKCRGQRSGRQRCRECKVFGVDRGTTPQIQTCQVTIGYSRLCVLQFVGAVMQYGCGLWLISTCENEQAKERWAVYHQGSLILKPGIKREEDIVGRSRRWLFGINQTPKQLDV